MNLTTVTEGGIYVFLIFDYYAASGMVLLFFCFCEVVCIGWVYGVKKWSRDVEDMVGHKVNIWLKICWSIVTPAASMVIWRMIGTFPKRYSRRFISQGLLLVAIIKYTPLTYNKDYEYPLSGQLLGGFLGVASTIWVPLYFMYSLIRAPGVKLREVMK